MYSKSLKTTLKNVKKISINLLKANILQVTLSDFNGLEKISRKIKSVVTKGTKNNDFFNFLIF